MLWVGTQDGLNRYDSEDVVVFRHDPADASSLSDNHVSALLAARDGALWVGTQSGGVGRYDRDRMRFQNYFATPGQAGALASLPVHALAQDTAGRIWVASGQGHLQWLGPEAQRFEDVAVPEDALIRVLLATPDADLIIGSSGGLWRYRAASGRLEPFARSAWPQTLDVQSLARDSRGNIWVGTVAQGVFRFSPEGDLQTRFDAQTGLAGDDVRALLVDRTARVWIGTYTGLSRIDAEGAPPRSWDRDELNLDGLRSDRVHALIEDSNGMIWVGTWLGGVHA
jgi:ligand-binding sensor domain-containing protein